MMVASLAQSTTAFARKNCYDRDELVACAEGRLFGSGNARLPLPPMLMCDRITLIRADGGAHGRGQVCAELDVTPDLWFFGCHFAEDPVMPGCLGLDALWQLLGFHLAWLGGPGRGRALGADEVRFTGQITPRSRLVSYTLDIQRVLMRKLYMGVADGTVAVDGRPIYHAKGLRVGLFTSTEDF